MNKSLKERLLEITKSKGMSVPKVAKDTGIPADRIYKWYQQGTNPKPEDAVLIEKWINGYLSGQSPMSQDPLPSGDKYVQLMEKVISALEKDKAWLQGIIETNLVGISDQTKVALGYQKAWVDYIAERDASGNPKKVKEIRAQMDRLIASKLGISDEMGIATDGRN